jgi:hypothetical protein
VTEREPSSLRWESNVWLRVLRDSDHWQIALQITDPSSRQQFSGKRKEKVKSGHGPQRGARHHDILTDWLTTSRKVTSTGQILLTVTDKRQTRPLVRRGVPQRQNSNFQTELISGRKSNSGLDTKTYWLTDWLTDRPSVVTWFRLRLLFGGISGPPCSWGIWIRGPGPPDYGSCKTLANFTITYINFHLYEITFTTGI